MIISLDTSHLCLDVMVKQRYRRPAFKFRAVDFVREQLVAWKIDECGELYQSEVVGGYIAKYSDLPPDVQLNASISNSRDLDRTADLLDECFEGLYLKHVVLDPVEDYEMSPEELVEASGKYLSRVRNDFDMVKLCLDSHRWDDGKSRTDLIEADSACHTIAYRSPGDPLGIDGGIVKKLYMPVSCRDFWFLYPKTREQERRDHEEIMAEIEAEKV